jgi:Cft2 family RNA processing exonuclease
MHVDAAFLSHAHQDHVGSLPLLVRQHPETPIFSTDATRQLADVMLHNSVNVMQKRHEQENGPPALFTHREATSCLRRFFPLPVGQRFNLEGERLGPTEPSEVALELTDAGHILGSASAVFEFQGKRILYTGDVNFHDQSLMRGAQLPTEGIDTVIIECTRGGTPNPDTYTTRENEEHRFAAAIREIFAQGGSVLIPVFALGKTQELLVMLHTLRQKGLLPECPLYIGGLSTKLTEIHDALAKASERQHPHLDLLETLAPFTLSGRDIQRLSIRPGRIYALSSGMMTEHTLSNLVAPLFLPNPAHGIFFIGYADPESPAGKLRTVPRGEKFMASPETEPETVRCRVETFAFSAHSDRNSLVHYLTQTAPRRILLVHGDPESSDWMEQTLRPLLPDCQIHRPAPGVTLDL